MFKKLEGASVIWSIEGLSPKSQRMTIPIVIMTSEGSQECWILIDSSLDLNIICQNLMKKWRINPVKELQGHPSAINGEKLFDYGIQDLEMHVYDCDGWMNAYCGFFHAAEISGVDIILGYPWLHAVNSGIDWKEQAWQYLIDPGQVSIVGPEEFALEMEEARQVFTVMLSSLMKADQSAQVMLPRELADFQDVVATGEELMLSLHESVMHHIDMEDQEVSYRLLYNLSPCELRVLCEYLDDALAKGWIQHSVSSAGSLILFIPKRDGSLWLCVDYQGLNKKMIKNHHSLSLIDETLNCLVRFYYFMKLDLKDAYHWIQIAERDWWKTVFCIRYEHFEYLVMPFSLANVLVTFQAYINEMLWHLVDTICVVYLDDILVYFTIREQYIRDVCAVFLWLQEYHLYVNLKKCSFFVLEVEFLGFIVGTVGVKMDPSQVESVTIWPQPASYKDVQIFLSFVNFYCWFISHYSKIAVLLTGLLKGSVKGKKTELFEFPLAAEESFDELQKAFCSVPVLRHFNPVLPIWLETDASGFVLVDILSQLFRNMGGDGTSWHSVVFWSWKMTNVETCYETHDYGRL